MKCNSFWLNVCFIFITCKFPSLLTWAKSMDSSRALRKLAWANPKWFVPFVESIWINRRRRSRVKYFLSIRINYHDETHFRPWMAYDFSQTCLNMWSPLLVTLFEITASLRFLSLSTMKLRLYMFWFLRSGSFNECSTWQSCVNKLTTSLENESMRKNLKEREREKKKL